MRTSKAATSAILRVTSVMRWILAVAARRPSMTGSGRRALSRPHSLATVSAYINLRSRRAVNRFRKRLKRRQGMALRRRHQIGRSRLVAALSLCRGFVSGDNAPQPPRCIANASATFLSLPTHQLPIAMVSIKPLSWEELEATENHSLIGCREYMSIGKFLEQTD